MPGFDEIIKFLNVADSGLKLIGSDKNQVLLQTADGKSLQIKPQSIDSVLKRDDSEGNPFLQVNFINGSKVLLTKHLIGFKPSEGYGLNETRLPKVVTTPDLLSIIDVIADADDFDQNEFDVLRKVYLSILDGGEAVGFDLSRERQWLSQLNIFIATA